MTSITKRKKIKYCKCGCGQAIIIKPHHKYFGIPNFIHGHNNCINGKMLISEETRRKISNTLIGHSISEETKEKISNTLTGKYPKGKHPLCKRIVSEESKEKNRLWHLGRKQTEESNVKRSLALKGRIFSKEHNEKISKSRKGMKFTETHKQKIKDLWKNPTYVNNMLKKLAIRPNKSETIILNLLNDLYPNEWKYTGDFSFMINGKNPDFTNCNGKKKLIELFGDYWHKGEDPQDRINIFKKFGYDTLVIWESELKDINKVKNKIIKFNKRR